MISFRGYLNTPAEGHRGKSTAQVKTYVERQLMSMKKLLVISVYVGSCPSKNFMQGSLKGRGSKPYHACHIKLKQNL